MDNTKFRRYAHEFADWMADYLEDIEQYPVKSKAAPGDIFQQIPESAPTKGETMDTIFRDFREKILPGVTHWQSPGFFAYFPANSSYPSLLAEMLTATMGAQCMIWETSPAAAELEEKVMIWLRQMLDLPEYFTGVIQDTASTATLCAILTAREKYTGWQTNENGFKNNNMRVYCSSETHSSIEKDVKIAGIGRNNLVKIPVSPEGSMQTDILDQKIGQDMDSGRLPLCVIATIGTTGTCAVDDIAEIGKICAKHGVWQHVDAAFAGSALILPECRHLANGIENADSFVFNPHKWLFTNFDCSAYFVKDREALVRTFEILPEYLKTSAGSRVNNYRDWGVPLGRRFRALKLWFVLRSFGVSGLQERLRKHIRLAKQLAETIRQDTDFELMAPVNFSLVCFRYVPDGTKDAEHTDELNRKLLEKLNASGNVYLSHTRFNGKYILRMSISQTNVEERHVWRAWEEIKRAVG